MKKCPKCGSRTSTGSVHCNNCGARLTKGKYAKKTKKKPVVLVLILVGIAIITMVVIGVMLKRSDDKTEKNYYWDQVYDYSIVSESDAGNTVVSITAPDYAALAMSILQENGGAKINSKTLSEAIDNNSIAPKEYIVQTTTTDEESIKRAFLDQVARELMIEALSRSDHTENWGEEQ